MKKLESWQTTDGQIFNIKEIAQEHQSQLDFVEWYESSLNNQLPGYKGSSVMHYILANQPQILTLLRGMYENTGKFTDTSFGGGLIAGRE